MKKQFFIYITLLFHILLIKEINSYEEEILNKFGSIKTKYSSMILNTSEFERGDDIYITFESELNCDNYIWYQFYDDINEIYNQTSDLKFNLRAESSSVTNILGKKTHLSFYYTINKNRESLDNSNGNILYFEFKCEGEVEIKNSKTNPSIYFLIIGILIVILFFIFFCFLCIKGCLYYIICFSFFCKRRTNYNMNPIPNNAFMNLPQRIVYIPQNANIYQNNRNNIYPQRNYANRVQYVPQQGNSQNSSSAEIMNSTERNLIHNNS